MRTNFVFGCFSFFVSFSAQNQIPQIIIRKGGVIYQNKALSVVIPTTLENFKKKILEKDWLKVFDFWSNFDLIRRACRLTIAYLSSF